MNTHHNGVVVYDREQGDTLYMSTMSWNSHINEGSDRVIHIL